MNDDVRRPAPVLATLAFATLVTLCIVTVARSRGIWLDELWSQRLGDPSVALPAALGSDWASDTHPPLANLLYRLVLSSGAASIESQRLLLNLSAALALFAGVLVFSRGDGPAKREAPLILAAVTFGLPGTIETFTDFRSYGWQIAAIITLLLYAGRLLSQARLTKLDHCLGGIALFLALSLHYVTGIILSFFAVGLIAVLCRARLWRVALFLSAIAVSAWTSLMVSGVILLGRMRQDIDFGWILTSTPTGALLFGVVALLTVMSAPLVAVFAARNLSLRGLAPGEKTLVLVLGGTLVAGFAALLAVNAVTPIIVQRYLIGWQLMFAALLVVLSGPVLARNALASRAVLLIAAAMTVAGAVQAAANSGWSQNRDRIAAIVRGCTEAKVYAMSPWRLKAAHASNSARRETVVIAAGYRMLARGGGFAVNVLDLEAPAAVEVGPRCPTLIWIEHLDAAYIPDPDYIRRVGKLMPSRDVTTTLVTSPSGMIAVLRAKPPRQNLRATPK